MLFSIKYSSPSLTFLLLIINEILVDLISGQVGRRHDVGTPLSSPSSSSSSSSPQASSLSELIASIHQNPSAAAQHHFPAHLLSEDSTVALPHHHDPQFTRPKFVNINNGHNKDFSTVDLEKDNNDTHHQTWMKSGKFQGDIAGIDPIYGLSNDDGRQHNAIRNRNLRWRNGVVPYVLATTYTEREKRVIRRAMETYHQRTCIKFVPRTSQTDYLFIVKSYGHEQSRSDRDEFVRIQWQNIIPGMRGQFDKISTAYQDFLGEDYDYRSVMHYDSRAFSRNGRNTIETVQPGFTRTIGRAKDLSAVDIRKVNKLYQCSTRERKASTDSPAIINVLPSAKRTTPRPRVIVTPRPKPKVVTQRPIIIKPSTNECGDKFLDCPFFHRYCFRRSFFFIMKLYCPKTCGHCSARPKNTLIVGNWATGVRHMEVRKQPVHQITVQKLQPSQPRRLFGNVFGSFFG